MSQSDRLPMSKAKLRSKMLRTVIAEVKWHADTLPELQFTNLSCRLRIQSLLGSTSRSRCHCIALAVGDCNSS